MAAFRVTVEDGVRGVVCHFDFNAVYGADFVGDFIQVHHGRSITELDDAAPNIESEPVPLCANCHCITHRERGRLVPVEELTERISKVRNRDVPSSQPTPRTETAPHPEMLLE